MTRTIETANVQFRIRGSFTISRGAKTHADVVTVTVAEGPHAGRGECVPYKRYGESVQTVLAQIETIRPALQAGANRLAIQDLLAPGAARNAVDCALWDLEAKQSGTPAWQLMGLSRPTPLVTAYTLSLDDPDAMEKAAREQAWRPLIKVKVGTADDIGRIRAVRSGAPDSIIILDANEGWTADNLAAHMAAAAEARISLIEQPLPAGQDAALAAGPRAVPICADESVHDRKTLAGLADRYDAVNIKLDKTGGLTEALAMKAEAERLGFAIMVGCMLGSSLAMAPAILLAQGVDFVDLDGPLLLAEDRDPALHYDGSTVMPPEARLWG